MSQRIDEITQKRKDAIASLRGYAAYADFMEAHPEAQVPYRPEVYHLVRSRREMVAVMKALGGKWDEEKSSGGTFRMRQEIAGIPYVVFIPGRWLDER